MASRSLSGFRGAPLTKGLLFTTVATSMLSGALSGAAGPRSDLPPLLRMLSFPGAGTLCIGVGLLYCFRLLERQEGPVRSLECRLASCGLALGVQAAARWATGTALVSAPYALVFTDLVAYWATVPVLQDFSLLGLRLNDKAFVYAAGLQLALLQGRQSLLAAGCALLAGILYHANIFNLQSWKAPPRMRRGLALVLSWMDGCRGTGTSQSFVAPGAPQHGDRQAPATRPGPPLTRAADVPRTEVSQEALQALQAMGFDPDRAREALERSDNSVERALTYLL
ncbi:hypothetical protein ACKKBF_B15370 [Auxenochlorella protothecoides x Auxenochlorella symbiontica]